MNIPTPELHESDAAILGHLSWSASAFEADLSALRSAGRRVPQQPGGAIRRRRFRNTPTGASRLPFTRRGADIRRCRNPGTTPFPRGPSALTVAAHAWLMITRFGNVTQIEHGSARRLIPFIPADAAGLALG